MKPLFRNKTVEFIWERSLSIVADARCKRAQWDINFMLFLYVWLFYFFNIAAFRGGFQFLASHWRPSRCHSYYVRDTIVGKNTKKILICQIKNELCLISIRTFFSWNKFLLNKILQWIQWNRQRGKSQKIVTIKMSTKGVFLCPYQWRIQDFREEATTPRWLRQSII